MMSYSKMIVPGIICVVLIGGGLATKAASHPVLANSNTVTNTNPPILQAKPNKILRGTWNLTVTSVEFNEVSSDPSKKGASIDMTIENAAGRDKAFLPNGYIAALVGTSGKVYTSRMTESLGQSYNNAKESNQKWAKEQGKIYYPGEFKIGEMLIVDSSEENFTKVIYQDEKGQKVEFPIQGITPKIIKHNPDAK